MKRLLFGVGQGEWKSTEWISDDVQVQFYLLLRPRASRPDRSRHAGTGNDEVALRRRGHRAELFQSAQLVDDARDSPASRCLR